MRRHSIILTLLLTFSASSLLASGGMAIPKRDKASDAIAAYNDGIAARDRAWQFEKELEAAQDAAQKTKLAEKIAKAYKSAVRAQRDAVRNDPKLFQAHAELGYALRKTGDYTAALQSYDRALALQPNYAEAIEYRGEAYLGLNRVIDARDAYLVLFNGGDATRSQMLATAMAKWIEKRRVDSAGVDTATIDELAKFLEQRTEISHNAVATSGSWK